MNVKDYVGLNEYAQWVQDATEPVRRKLDAVKPGFLRPKYSSKYAGDVAAAAVEPVYFRVTKIVSELLEELEQAHYNQHGTSKNSYQGGFNSGYLAALEYVKEEINKMDGRVGKKKYIEVVDEAMRIYEKYWITDEDYGKDVDW